MKEDKLIKEILGCLSFYEGDFDVDVEQEDYIQGNGYFSVVITHKFRHQRERYEFLARVSGEGICEMQLGIDDWVDINRGNLFRLKKGRKQERCLEIEIESSKERRMRMEEPVIYKKTVNIKCIETITIKQAISELSLHHNEKGLREQLINGGLIGTPSSLYTTNKEFLEE